MDLARIKDGTAIGGWIGKLYTLWGGKWSVQYWFIVVCFFRA